MLRTIQKFFEANLLPATTASEDDSSFHALRLAAAALLIEVARADFRVDDRERRMVEDAVRKVFGLSPEETGELVRMAEEEADRALSLYEFTLLVDRGFPLEQKKRIIELLWRVALSDSELEKHEEYLIRKIATLVHVHHEDFIAAKLRAREALRQDSSQEHDRR